MLVNRSDTVGKRFGAETIIHKFWTSKKETNAYLNVQRRHCFGETRRLQSLRLEQVNISFPPYHSTLNIIIIIADPKGTTLVLIEMVEDDLVLDVIH